MTAQILQFVGFASVWGALAAAFAGPHVTPEQAAGIAPIGHQVQGAVPAIAAPAALPTFADSCVGCAQCTSDCDGDDCRDEGLRSTFREKKRDLYRDCYRDSFDRYRTLHHPICPPYCSPSWGYYQTCWRRFPEETLWCPPCQDAIVPVTSPVMPPGAGSPPLPAPPAQDAYGVLDY